MELSNTWVQVNLARLEENLLAIRRALAPTTEQIFVVKANAYGHGVSAVVQRACRCGLRWFAVAHLEEAELVRAACPDAVILLLGVAHAAQVPELLRLKVVPIIVDLDQGKSLALAASALGTLLPVHFKVDTGMGRFGVDYQQAPGVFANLQAGGGLQITGVCTHFASVEVRKESMGSIQMDRFMTLRGVLEKDAGRHLMFHASSSRAFLCFKEWDLDGIRPGISAYGYGAGEKGMRACTEPVLQWKTRVLQVKKVPAGFPVGYYGTHVTLKPTTIATLAAGYADGYHRALSNKGSVLIRGRRCAVVGRVSMNWITADAGPDADIQPGDEAVLIGRQGSECIWADELARLAKTIPYEILTSIQPLARRTYAESS